MPLPNDSSDAGKSKVFNVRAMLAIIVIIVAPLSSERLTCCNPNRRVRSHPNEVACLTHCCEATVVLFHRYAISPTSRSACREAKSKEGRGQ